MSDVPEKLKLVVCVVKDYAQRDMILEGLIELGITGATVLEAQGMAQVLVKDVPIFAGLSSFFPKGSRDSHVILSVLSTSILGDVVSLVKDVFGEFDSSHAGILFTVPVSEAWGLPKELD